MIHLLAVGCVGAVIVLLAAEAMGWTLTRAVSKSVAALCFVTYGVALGALTLGAGGALLILGLVLSLIGDVCLLSDRTSIFKAGILAFLAAHIAYVGLFSALSVQWMWVTIGGIGVAMLAVPVGWTLAPHVGALKGAVFAYIAVISLMVAMAVGMFAVELNEARTGLLVSAIAFFLSDLCVARQRFMTPQLINKLIGLPLYFGAQLGFAWFGVQVLSA